MKSNIESIDAYVSFVMQYKTLFRQLLEIHISDLPDESDPTQIYNSFKETE